MGLLFSSKMLIFVGAALLLSPSIVHARANININEIRYPLDLWSPSALNIIDNGPSILSKDELFNVKDFPDNDSQITKDELAYLLDISENERSVENLENIVYEHSSGAAYTYFLKSGILNSNNLETIKLLMIIDNDHGYFILKSKRGFERPRPSQLSPNLELVVPDPLHSSYPSGHASQSYMVALVLSDFDQGNADIYKQFAIDVAHRREIAGIHYPSDSVAGRVMAVDVLARLRLVPEFEKKYKLAKASFIISGFLPDDNEVEQAQPID